MGKIIPRKFAKVSSGRRAHPPADLATRWVAWSNDGSRIVADGDSFEAARAAARDGGEPDPIVEQDDPIKARRA